MNTNQEKIASTISNLVETCRDGIKGYETAAENVDNPQVKAELTKFARQRTQFLHELEAKAQQFGVTPPKQETTVSSVAMEAAGAVHRGWINLKSAVTGHDSKAILNECETGDTAAVKTYQSALKDPDLPAAFKSVVEKQCHEIEAAVSQISSMKKTITT